MGLHQLSRLAAALAVFSLLPGCGCNKAPPATPTLKDEGQDCKRDDECKTGLCDSVPGFATVCVRGCEQGCAATEVCTQLQPARFACQPDRGGLCKRCELDTDCPYPADKCIVVNNEKVCGRDCAFDGTCPGSYRCLSGLGADGLNKPQQCTPQSGTCACTATTSGQSISCQVENGFGRCTGERVCEGTTGYGACTARTPVKESCNGVDDDCNGTIDDSLPTVTCGVGACQRTASSCVAGQSGACTPGDAGVEACNGLDDDCDGAVDNGFSTATDVNNCGACGRVCALANATPKCAASTCDVLSCNAGFGNCDGLAPNGCEANLTTDTLHCGSCTNACTFANATPRCEPGGCKFTCLPNFYDLNANPADGCEYACTFTSAVDLPDLAFVDANCDGIDGELNNGIFVAPAPIGNDVNPGTKAQPKATPAAGIAAAKVTSKRDVYLAAGTYTGTLDVTGFPNKYIAGGYAPGDFKRSLVNTTTVSNGNPAVRVDASGGTTLQFLTVQGANAASADLNGDGQSAYGALVKNSAQLKLEGLSITAGAASAGLAGLAGTVGLDGSNGGNGSSGCVNDDTLPIICTLCNQPARGTAGPSPAQCGRTGGQGGAPTDRYTVPGGPGSLGVVASTGGLGTPGQNGNWIPPAQYNGGDGAPGGPGLDGAGAPAVGAIGALGTYLLPIAQSGTAGTHGNGGGGGGAGGGGLANSLFNLISLCYTYGSAGGGGGGGGCGAGGGGAGRSGGGSFAVFLVNSTVTATNCTLGTGAGGRGGNGGAGGAASVGGTGGGSLYNVGQDTGSRGGKGGNGGGGGKGGAGGGGAGGPVIGVARDAASSWVPNVVSITLGTAGVGGASGNPNGPSGAAGLSQDNYAF